MRDEILKMQEGEDQFRDMRREEKRGKSGEYTIKDHKRRCIIRKRESGEKGERERMEEASEK